MDSLKIVEKVETLYPEPPLHLHEQLHGEVAEAVKGAAIAILGDILLLCVRNCLSETSASYFTEARKKQFGMSLEDFAAKKGGEAAWQAAAAAGGPFEGLKNQLTLHKKDDGPFVLGSKVSYGDFVAASFFECMARADLKSYVRLMSFDESFTTLHQACRPWLQRDN